MAKQQGITQTPLRFNAQDPAVAARRRVQYAGEDDAAYGLAIVALETAPATSVDGVKALFELYSSRVESLFEGDEMPLETMKTLALNIVAGLENLRRKAG